MKGWRTFSSGGLGGRGGGIVLVIVVVESSGGSFGSAVDDEGSFDAFTGAPEVAVEGMRPWGATVIAGGAAGC